MTSYTKKVFLPCHVLGIVGLPIAVENSAYFLYTIFFFVLTAQAGFEIGYHRMLTHKSFETSKLWEIILIFLGTLSGVGQPLFFASMHRQHHRYADTVKDPHSPTNGIIRSSLYSTYLGNVEQVNIFQIRDLVKNKTVLWFDRNYYKIFWLVTLAFAFVDIRYALFGPIYGCVLSIHSFAVMNVLLVHTKNGVRKGYRNHDTNENSTNRPFLAYLLGWYSWGGFLHNNHHAEPGSYRMDHTKNEFDLGRHFIDLIREPKKP